ncbi:MAG: hypothetical protein KDB53_05905 [Planctomycetes bacterium]|nr:hypothetical protein [Planctomycetota bacterium]
MMMWGKLAAFWGLFVGSAIFVLPGVGPVVVFGPLVGCTVGALEGAVVVGGLGAMGAGLPRSRGRVEVKASRSRILQYETAL